LHRPRQHRLSICHSIGNQKGVAGQRDTIRGEKLFREEEPYDLEFEETPEQKIDDNRGRLIHKVDEGSRTGLQYGRS
jgi:hypothetical protein